MCIRDSPIAAAENEVLRIPILSADNLPLEHSGAFRIHIRGDAFGPVSYTHLLLAGSRLVTRVTLKGTGGREFAQLVTCLLYTSRCV